MYIYSISSKIDILGIINMSIFNNSNFLDGTIKQNISICEFLTFWKIKILKVHYTPLLCYVFDRNDVFPPIFKDTNHTKKKQNRDI